MKYKYFLYNKTTYLLSIRTWIHVHCDSVWLLCLHCLYRERLLLRYWVPFPSINIADSSTTHTHAHAWQLSSWLLRLASLPYEYASVAADLSWALQWRVNLKQRENVVLIRPRNTKRKKKCNFMLTFFFRRKK